MAEVLLTDIRNKKKHITVKPINSSLLSESQKKKRYENLKNFFQLKRYVKRYTTRKKKLKIEVDVRYER